MIALLRSPWAILALVVALAGSHLAAYLSGRGDGAKAEAVRWQADKIKDQQRAAEEAQALREAVAARDAALAAQVQEGADDVAQIKVVQLPARVEIRRQIVEKPVYRECRAEQRLLDLVNAARAGRAYVPGTVPAADGGMPGDAAAGG